MRRLELGEDLIESERREVRNVDALDVRVEDVLRGVSSARSSLTFLAAVRICMKNVWVQRCFLGR